MKSNLTNKYFSLFVSIIFNIGPTHFRCAEVEIDYGSVSLDVNVVIEYITRQLLSLDIIKSAIKKSEVPIRNVIINAIRVLYLINYIKEQSLKITWISK